MGIYDLQKRGALIQGGEMSQQWRLEKDPSTCLIRCCYLIHLLTAAHTTAHITTHELTKRIDNQGEGLTAGMTSKSVVLETLHGVDTFTSLRQNLIG